MNAELELDPKEFIEFRKNENIATGYFIEKDSGDALAAFLDKLKNLGFSFSVRSSTSPKTESPSLYVHYTHKNVNIEPGALFAKKQINFYDCRHGDRYYQINEDAPEKEAKRFRVQNTKKMDCPAKMEVVEITVYPEYRISKNANWRLKKNVREQAQNDILKNDKIKKETRYYFSISTIHNHSVATSLLNQKMDVSLLKVIENLVEKGISNVQYIKKRLKDFVREHHSEVSFTSSAFYPKTHTIYNQVLKCINKKYQSTIDQEKILFKANEWNKNGDSCFFRPYSNDENDANSVKSLLFVYQNEWQQKLLQKYGSVCCLDATYKTMKYALPLFFLTVKTNVNYAVVAVFIVQHENSQAIGEALQVLKSWNPQWKPEYYMTDFCQAEINAIESTFKCPTFICSFHREQAWLRWLKTKENVNNVDDSKILLKYWRSIAHAETKADFKKYEDELIESTAWIDNVKAQKYFSDTWLPVKEKWCEAFFNEDFLFKITTNNGAEAQNRALKYSYLKQYSNKSMTSVIEVIVNEFISDSKKKYTIENSLLNSKCKKYNAGIPAFLNDRPLFFVRHVNQRFTKAKKVYVATMIHQLSESKFVVRSENSETWYAVDFAKPTCTCDDFRRWRFPCKHFCAIFHFVPNHSFNNLPKAYLENPFLNIDKEFSIFNDSNEVDLDIENQPFTEENLDESFEIFEVLELTMDSESSQATNEADSQIPNAVAIPQVTENVENQIPVIPQDPQVTNDVDNQIPVTSQVVKNQTANANSGIITNAKKKMKDLTNLMYLIRKNPESEALEKFYEHLTSAEQILNTQIDKENGVELLPLPPPKKKKKKQR